MTARHTNQITCQEKWKKLRFWKNEAQNQVRIFWQNLMFWAEIFFQKSLEFYWLTLWKCSKYLKGPSSLVVCFNKKIVTARHTNQITCQEEWKKLRFWKNEAQNLKIKLEYSDKCQLFQNLETSSWVKKFSRHDEPIT